MTTFAHLPLAQITASLTNPRKTFDQDKLAELAASIVRSYVVRRWFNAALHRAVVRVTSA